MKQNPTFPAVLEVACVALWKITENPENEVIAVAAGAVQVHLSASSYTITIIKKSRTTGAILHPTPLPLALHLPLPMVLQPLSLR